MWDSSGDRIVQLLAELRETQSGLSQRQGELLRAIAIEDPRVDVVRREVVILSRRAMAIIGEVENELRRRHRERTEVAESVR